MSIEKRIFLLFFFSVCADVFIVCMCCAEVWVIYLYVCPTFAPFLSWFPFCQFFPSSFCRLLSRWIATLCASNCNYYVISSVMHRVDEMVVSSKAEQKTHTLIHAYVWYQVNHFVAAENECSSEIPDFRIFKYFYIYQSFNVAREWDQTDITLLTRFFFRYSNV